MKSDKGEYIQTYYEIAMSIGVSLDFAEMIRHSLTAYTKKLQCCCGVIVRKEGKIEKNYDISTQVFSVPRKEVHKKLIELALLTTQEITHGGINTDTLPIVNSCMPPLCCHVMSLGEYGFLFLFKKGSPLPSHVLHSLAPLNEKLASFCLACETKSFLSESEAKYRRIFQNVRDIYIEIDPDNNKILEISPSVYQILGYKREELIGRNPVALLRRSSPDSVIKQLTAEKRIVDFETRIKTKKGIEHVFSVSASINKDNADRQKRFVGILRDIGRRKLAEEALLESRNRLEEQVSSRTKKLRETNRSLEAQIKERVEAENSLKQAQTKLIQTEKLVGLGQLASGIAHEINNPVQYIGTHIQFLEESCQTLLNFIDNIKTIKNLSQSQIIDLHKQLSNIDYNYLKRKIPESLEHSIEGVEQISSIVQGMNIFAHSGTKEKSEYSINEIIQKTIRISKHEWKNNVEIETHFEEDLPPIMCVAHSMGQVFLNILVNAIHAVEERKTISPKYNGTIIFSTSHQDDSIVISVQDNGVGIKNKNVNRIFEPFYTTKAPGKGTGQGLAIVYSIITQEHKGTVEVKSKHLEGTTFTITLPVPTSSVTFSNS